MANNQSPKSLTSVLKNAASSAATAAADRVAQNPTAIPAAQTKPQTPAQPQQQKPLSSLTSAIKSAATSVKASADTAVQREASRTPMDLFLDSTKKVGTSTDPARVSAGAMNTLRSDLITRKHSLVEPAYKDYQSAQEKLASGQMSRDEFKLVEDSYRSLATSYNKMYDTYDTIVNHSYDWNAPDTSAMGDTLDALGKSMQQVEAKLGEQAEQIEKLYAEYNAVADKYKANPTQTQMLLAQQKWEKLAAAQDQYNADVMVLQYMYGEYDNGANILQQRYYEDHPTALYAQNIGGYDKDGSYRVTESWDDTLKRIDDLQAQASKATGEQAKKLNDEIQFYWDMFDTGYYDGLVDVDQMRDLADTLEPEVKAARMAEQQAREAVSNMEYLGTFEGPEYEAAKQRVSEAQYNLAELQKRRGNAEAAISQLTYRSEIEKLPAELQVSMDDLIDDMAEAGDFNYYLRNRNGDRNGDVTLSYETHNPEVVNSLNDVEAQLRKAGYSSEQVDGMLMYLSREANKQRVRELQDLVGQKSYNAEYEALQNAYEDAKDSAFRLLQVGYTEDSPEYKEAVEARDAALDALNDYDGVHRSRSGFGNWLASLGNGLASGTGYLDLAMQKADVGVDPFTGRAMQLDYNTNPNDFYAKEQAIASAQMDRYLDKAFEKYGPTEKAEKVAQRKMNIYQLTESMTQSALVAALSWAGAGPAGLLMLSGSAATQTAQDMHERGYSDGAAILGGFVAGAAEYVTENLPTEHLLGMLTRNAGVLTGKDLLISVGLNQLTQSIEEGLEEGSSDIINLMFEQMAADLNGGGLDSIREEALDAVKQARINGKELSYEDALKGAWTDWTKTWTDDMKAGALSGLFMAGGATMLNGGISAIGNRMGGNEVLQSGNAFAFQQFMDSVDSATLRGANFTPGTGYGRAGKIGRALNNLSSVYVSDAINSRLSEMGEESSPTLVAAIRHSAAGDRLTPVEAAAFNKSEHAQTLANELKKADPGSWADTAIRAGNDMSMTFRGHDASEALTKMVVAQSAPTMKDLASYKVRLGSEGTAEQKVQKVVESGFASNDEIRDIVKTPALRAAYESIAGTELPKNAAEARKEIRAKLPPLEGNAAAEEYLSMQRSNPDSTILRPIATELTEAGITSGTMAQSQGSILEKVFSGEDLTPFELGKLDLNNAAVRAVFARRSGMTNIPEDLNITPTLKKAYVDTVLGQVKGAKSAQQALANGADQLMEAQAQSSAAKVADLTAGAQAAGEQAAAPGKGTRAQNKAAEAARTKLAYRDRQREAARGKTIVTKDRTAIDILKQVRKQANDNSLVLKPAFADVMFPGVTNLTTEQKAELDDKYRKYLEKAGLTRAEIRAMTEASNMVGAKTASTAAEIKTEAKTEAKAEAKTEAKTETKAEAKTEEKAEAKPKTTPIRAAVKVGLDQNNSAFRLLRSSKNITQRTIRQLDFLGRALGLQIRFEQSIEAGVDPETGAMRYANAQYVPGQRVLRIAVDTDDPVSVAVIHEAVHELYRNNKAAFNELRDTVYTVMEQNPEVFDTLKTAVAKEYNTSKDSALTEEEIVCQAVGVVLAKTDVLDRMPANGKVILRNAIVDLLDKLRGYKDGVGGTTALYEDAFHDLEKAADRLAEQFSRGLQEQEANIRQTNADLVGVDHEATVDLRHDTAPETREPSDMTRYSLKSLAEAAGFQFDPITRTFQRNGAEVRHVTDEDIENSPIGALINYSYDQGYLGAVNSKEAKANRESQIRMFAQVADLCAQGGDFAMNMQVMGATLFTGMKANSDKQYNLTYDFPSICTKTQSMIDQMSARMMRDHHGLTKQELLTLYRETFFEGLPVPCPECYVFTHWVGIGGLLDNIWRYQETYKNKTPDQVRAEYDRINAELDKAYQAQLGNENSKTRSQVRTKMRKDATKALEELTATISSMEANGDTVPTELQAELDAAQSVSDMLDALSWIDTVYFKEGSNRRVRNENFYVPAEILFDLNGDFHTVEGKGPQRFADNYPEAWRFRTTQGAGYGKAITPYAEAELGAGIMITNDKSQIKVKAGQKKSKGKVVQWNNQFLQQKGHLNAATKKILDSAHKKQRAQAFLGGQRFQSTSDARFENVTDYLIAALEMQAMGGAVQVYTKVSGAVELFELLGFSTNQSLMPKGNGLTPDLSAPLDTPVGGMRLSVAEENRQKHEHAGTITIGVNDRHIRLMMREWVRDFIIPYHISGGDKNLIASFREVQEAGTSGMRQATIQSTDYTQTQGDKILTDEALKWMGKTKEEIDLIKARRQQRINILTGKGALDMNIIRGSQFLSELYDKLHGGEWDGVTVGKGVIESQIFPNEFWNTEVTYEQSGVNTKRYLDYCEELGFLHRFSGQRMKAVNVVGADGVKRTETHIMPVNGRDAAGNKYPLTDLAYVYDEAGRKTGQIEDFFWKTIVDRRMYGNDGKYLPQAQITLNAVTKGDVENFARNNAGSAREYDQFKSAQLAARLADADLNALYEEQEAKLAEMRKNGSGKASVADKAAETLGVRNSLKAAPTMEELHEIARNTPDEYAREALFLADAMIELRKNFAANNGVWKADVSFWNMSPATNYLERFDDKKSTKTSSDAQEFRQIIGAITDDKLLNDLLWYPLQDLRSQIRSRSATNLWKAIVKEQYEKVCMAKYGGHNISLDPKKTYGLPYMRDLFNQLNNNSDLSDLAQRVFALCDDFDVQFRTMSKGSASGDALANHVRLNKNYFADPSVSDQRKAGTILHECIHTATMYAFNIYDKGYQNSTGGYTLQRNNWHPTVAISKETADACKALYDIYDEIKDDPNFAGMYGATSAHEMVAELANTKFRDALAKKSLLDKVIDAIKKLLGIDTLRPNALDAAERALFQLLDEPDYTAEAGYNGGLIHGLEVGLVTVRGSTRSWGPPVAEGAKTATEEQMYDAVKDDDERFSMKSFKKEMTILNDPLYPKAQREQSAFNRSIANKTTGMKRGEKRTVVVFTEDKAYYVLADGYMSGRILSFKDTDDESNAARKDFRNADTEEEITHPVLEGIRDGRGRSGRHTDASRNRGASGRDAGMDGEPYYRNPRRSLRERLADEGISVNDDIRYSLKSARMTEKRIDYLIADSGAGKSKTYAQKWITSINPSDFLSLTLKADKQDREVFDRMPGDYGSTVNDADYVEFLKNETRQTPFLMIDSSGQVIGHEGRHRIRALEREGVNSAEVVVQIYSRDGRLMKNAHEINGRLETIRKFVFTNQYGTGQTATVQNIIPLNLDHRDEILAAYGEGNAEENDIRYSMKRTDSEGRELSPEQQEFFKDSKVRDENGNLLVVYHGTPSGGFTEFKLPEYLSPLMSAQGPGFYFTDERNARQYMKPVNKSASRGAKGQLYSVYLNITNPLLLKDYQSKLTKEQVVSILQKGDYDWFFQNGIFHEIRAEKGSLSREEAIDAYADKLLRSVYGDQDVLAGVVRAFRGGSNAILDAMMEATGNDGIRFTDRYGDIWVAWKQNQIKNVDNASPTDSTDIRYSMKRTDSEQRAFEQGRFVQGAQMAKEQRLANDAAQRALRVQQAKTAAAEAKADALKAEAAAKAAMHKANLELAKQRKSEQMRRINAVFRANGSPVRVGSNSDLPGAIDYELKRRQQLLNEAKDKLVDSQWETKMAQSDGEQKLKAVQRYWKDKFDYAHKTDKQWARGLKKSERQGTKAEGKRRTREALTLDRMDHSETARRAIRERNAFNRRGDEIVINDGQNVATPAPFTDERKVLQKAADYGKHAAKQIYGTFVNYAYGLEKMAKLQSRQDDLDVMVRMVRASSSTVERCFESGLVDRNGDIIGPAAKDVLLWTDAKGRLMKDMQAAQNDYMFHKHNVDRRSVETKARERVLQMQTQYPWLAEMSNQELGRLAASGNSIVNDYVAALQHANDIAARMRANPHYLAVFGDEEGNAFSAESSQRIVDEYERTMPQLKERAEQIYEWWDIFMREWAVGGSISMSQYEDMREMYPHYVPTYRKDNGPHAGGVSGNPAGLSAKPSTKRAVGSIRELEAMEDQYVNSMKKIIQGNRENAILRNIVEEFLFDEDGTFSDFGYFDLDSLTVSDRLDLLEFADESRLQSLTKHEITVDGKTSEVYHISCWVDGRKMSAYVNKEIFTGLKALFGQQDQFVRTATKIGHKVTAPMKAAITGVNPNFVLRNPMRDVQTALVNSVAGFAYVKYLGQAMAQMAEHSGNWTTFQNLGGVKGGQMSNESGFTEWAAELTSTKHKIAEIITKPGEITESAARFAEYLATLDMLGGDTPENRMVAIRNAARVTVDFGQRGTLGGLINSWVPYWNPNIQGIDLMIKNIAGQPTVKQALARLGRAAVVNILPQAIALAVIYGRGHKDDWDELSDQVKDNYFCLPIPGSRKFLKIPKSQDWGALIGTPFMRMIDGVMGRDDPFENYGVSAVLSNYNPLAWPIGLDWVMELKANKNFAGSAIIPYDLQDVSKREQYDKDTSMVSFAIARALGQSPMAIDYILSDYFGNFYGALIKLLPVGYVTDEVEPVDKLNEMLQSVVNPWVADPLYSNSTVSYYYDAINGLRQKVTDMDAHGSSKGTREAAILSALESSGGYISKISALSAQARELTKGDEKDALKLQIAGLADEALQFLKDCESGGIKDPELYMTYHKYGAAVMKEAENLKKYEDGFNFSGKLTQPKTFYDPDDKSHRYTLTDDQTAAYSKIREDAYKQTLINTISSSRYSSAEPAERAALLEAAKAQALDKAELQFAEMLRDEKVSFETIGKAGYDEERFAAAYGISEILGTDSAYSSALTDAMVNLYEYKTDYSFVPSYGDTKTFNSTTDSGMRYVLTNAQQAQYTNIRHDNFQSYADKVMKSSEWKSASPELQAAMLAEAKKLADKQSKKDFDQWLRNSGAVAQPKAQSNEVVVQEAQYAIDRVTGDSYALDKRVSDTLIRLWDYKDAGPNANFELDTLTPSATYAYDKQYQWVLNDEQKEVYRSIAGTIYNKHVLAVINAPGFDRLSDEEQARRIGVIRADLTAEVRETFKQWLIDHNVKPTPKKTTADLVSQQKIDASRKAVNAILGR